MMNEQMVKVEMANKDLNRMFEIVDIVDSHFKDGEIKDVADMVDELEGIGEY